MPPYSGSVCGLNCGEEDFGIRNSVTKESAVNSPAVTLIGTEGFPSVMTAECVDGGGWRDLCCRHRGQRFRWRRFCRELVRSEGAGRARGQTAAGQGYRHAGKWRLVDKRILRRRGAT